MYKFGVWYKNFDFDGYEKSSTKNFTINTCSTKETKTYYIKGLMIKAEKHTSTTMGPTWATFLWVQCIGWWVMALGLHPWSTTLVQNSKLNFPTRKDKNVSIYSPMVEYPALTLLPVIWFLVSSLSWVCTCVVSSAQPPRLIKKKSTLFKYLNSMRINQFLVFKDPFSDLDLRDGPDPSAVRVMITF